MQIFRKCASQKKHMGGCCRIPDDKRKKLIKMENYSAFLFLADVFYFVSFLKNTRSRSRSLSNIFLSAPMSCLAVMKAVNIKVNSFLIRAKLTSF